ncbi:ABC transporter ATP-binding protein [Demequina capsici]|uniref:ABC transporter ATP-binding protein n=1 Tax=Demequina capsici TaxID=3075620 RepID=A0AA96J9G1_9MICO|nr:MULTISPECIES: ABC transporter ATP-binding protein [unclassified Demequina]WNM24418.1 ABC transporter ATP-binding protein [Demequina sp. OYTSA14]WNM27252.1 ABC transporter ATP-binding protein [Demequina sp. PMTSA13]
MTPLLTAEGIDARYGDVRAVSGVSLHVDQGELLALVGANGAGKSTLLRVLAGAHRPVAGAVGLRGDDVTGLRDFERNRRGICLVPEGRRLFASLTVRENLLVGAGSRRPGRWDVDAVADVLPMLRPLLERNASQLSGGQQQAVAIGRALMSNPDVLLLDEVSLGLAPIVIDELYESLAAVRGGGLAVILVEQDLQRTLAVADRLVCMLEGEAVLEGTPHSLTHEAITDAYFGHVATPAGSGPGGDDGGPTTGGAGW